MKLFSIFKNTLIILSIAPFFSLVGLYGSSNLIAHGGEHHGEHHPHHDAARHDLNRGEFNHGGERRAFNRGAEAGAIEGAGIGGAAGAVEVDGNGWNQPVYSTPNPSAQPSVQYIQVDTPSK